MIVNILTDAMHTVMHLTAHLGPDGQQKIAAAMDAAIIFGAVQQRNQTGGFEVASDEMLRAMYEAKIATLKGLSS